MLASGVQQGEVIHHSVQVSIADSWNGTGIHVIRNQPITVSATGQWGATLRDTMGNDYSLICSADSKDASGNQVKWDISSMPVVDLKLYARIYSGGQIVSLHRIGSHSEFLSPADGELRFGAILDSWIVWMDLTMLDVSVDLAPAPITVSLPGKESTWSGGGIDGSLVVNEDNEFTWSGQGETTVTLASDSEIKYTFQFQDPYAEDFSKTFNAFSVPNILSEIKAVHKFKESGIYSIKLKIEYTDADSQSKKILYAGPYSIIVVDHLPEYIGAAIHSILGPGKFVEGSLDARNITVTNSKTDVIMEDVTQNSRGNIAEFTVYTTLKLYCELPEGEDTANQGDRFSGVIPESVKYLIEYGDGSPDSGLIPFKSVNKTKPNSVEDFNKTLNFTSDPYTHIYNEPGEYEMKVTLYYQVVEYEPLEHQEIIYSWKKKDSPVSRCSTITRKIIVADMTPPRIPADTIRDLRCTTGDPFSFNFTVEDNHTKKGIREAKLVIENRPHSEEWVEIPLQIVEDGFSEIRGKKYRIFTSEWIAPHDFATKQKCPEQFLRYYLKITDEEGNINNGWGHVEEDFPPLYLQDGIKEKKYGKLIIDDNDPPCVDLTIEVLDGAASIYRITENVHDFNEPDIYGSLTVINVINSNETSEHDLASNPTLTPQLIWNMQLTKTQVLKIPEKTRFQFHLNTSDNVDDKAEYISFSMDGMQQKRISAGKGSYSYIANQPGDHILTIVVQDSPNIDQKVSARKITLPIRIFNTSMMMQAIEHSHDK